MPELRLEAIVHGRGARGLTDFIRAHIVVLDDDEPDLRARLAREKVVELTAIDGKKVSLHAQRSWTKRKAQSVLVNDQHLVLATIQTGRNLVMHLEGVL